MSEEPSAEEIEAIQRVISAGVSGDFADVAAKVEQEFGLQVGPILVEQVYRAMQQQAAEQRSAAGSAGEGEAILRKVVKFAEEMGGFDQARAALDAVEAKMKGMK